MTETPPGRGRAMTAGEIAMARTIYKGSIDFAGVEIRRRKWAFFQPRDVAMAPTGHIHFHPQTTNWHEDFSTASLGLRGLFLHELCHIWQTQRGIFLPLKRHPFCRYDYAMKPGWELPRYGLEQQAEIVRHAYLLREGATLPGAPGLATYESLLRVFG